MASRVPRLAAAVMVLVSFIREKDRTNGFRRRKDQPSRIMASAPGGFFFSDGPPPAPPPPPGSWPPPSFFRRCSGPDPVGCDGSSEGATVIRCASMSRTSESAVAGGLFRSLLSASVVPLSGTPASGSESAGTSDGVEGEALVEDAVDEDDDEEEEEDEEEEKEETEGEGEGENKEAGTRSRPGGPGDAIGWALGEGAGSWNGGGVEGGAEDEATESAPHESGAAVGGVDAARPRAGFALRSAGRSQKKAAAAARALPAESRPKFNQIPQRLTSRPPTNTVSQSDATE